MIVNRVDGLMALLDRLETAQASRETTRQALRDAALSALREADDPEALHKGWARIASRMHCLFNDPSDIKPLREAILQLAVRGHLVPQASGDEPADKLLSRIARTRGSGKSYDGDAAGTGPFRLPDRWAWSTLDDLGEIKGGGTPSKKEPRFWGGEIPWVSPKDMKHPHIGESLDTVAPEAVEQTSVKEIGAGALLMVVRGMILAHSFPTALTTRPATLNQDMKALIPAEKKIGPYLLLATNALKPEVLKLVERSTHGTCKLPTAKLFRMPIPIPPLAEQHRIVAKMDEVMALCDDLEARLGRAREARAAFAPRRWPASRRTICPPGRKRERGEVNAPRFSERATGPGSPDVDAKLERK